MSDEAILEDYEDYEDYEAAEDYESEDYGEDYGEDLGERVLRFRRRARPRPNVARPSRNYVRPRPTSQYVTQQQLSTALAKVAADVKKNGTAITAVSRRVGNAEDVNRKQSADLAKQAKINDRQAKDIKKQSENAMLMTLLTQPKTLGATTTPDTIGGIAVEKGTKIATGGDNNLLLMLALTGGFGGGEGGMGDLLPLILFSGAFK